MSHLFNTDSDVKMQTPWYWSPYIIFAFLGIFIVIANQMYIIFKLKPWQKKKEKKNKRKKSRISESSDNIEEENKDKDMEKGEKATSKEKPEKPQRAASVWSMATDASRGSSVAAGRSDEAREMRMERMRKQIALWRMAQNGVTDEVVEVGQTNRQGVNKISVWSTSSATTSASAHDSGIEKSERDDSLRIERSINNSDPQQSI